MITALPLDITIETSGTEFYSYARKIPEIHKLIAWEYTTPNYSNSVTTTISILSPTGRALLTGSAISKNTADVKICNINEKAPLGSGFKIKATLSGDAGGSNPYTLNIILYAEV